MARNVMYSVKNRSTGMCVYRIPEDNIRREFAPGEVKKISGRELEKLSYRPGGRALMANFLQIMSEEALDKLNIRTQPEYNMSEAQIVDLIKNGSLEAFLDCLDFAPIGVIDLLKTLSVSTPLTDSEKRAALKSKTGFDVTNALRHVEEEKEEDNVVKQVPTDTAKTATTTAGRRTSGSNYKIVEPKSAEQKVEK